MHKGNFIGGRWSEIQGSTPREIIDPATGEAFAEVPESTALHAADAVAAAVAGQQEWGGTPPAERASRLLELAAAVQEHEAELAAIDRRNVGKPVEVALAEPRGAVDQLQFYAGAARNVEGRASGEYVRGATSMMRRDPLGVVASIVPWNYPLATAAAKIAPAIAAGNSVVLKPSELTPLSTLRLAELSEGILPPGVLNVVIGDGLVVGNALTRHPDVAMVSMTGSTSVGRAIAQAAAVTLKRVHLELGGNAPVVVFDDADLEQLVETLRFAAFWNSGQECGAASRILVQRGARDRLLELLVPMAESVVVGDPADPATELGPLISRRQLERARGLLESAEAEGARILTGGGDGGMTRGFYLEPTIVVDAGQHSPLVAGETFAPVLTVQTFDDEAEALGLANDSPYALSASVWTSDVSRGMRVSRSLNAGTTWLNTHLLYFTEMPWGGPGASGGGVDGSLYALEEHTQLRHMVVNFG